MISGSVAGVRLMPASALDAGAIYAFLIMAAAGDRGNASHPARQARSGTLAARWPRAVRPAAPRRTRSRWPPALRRRTSPTLSGLAGVRRTLAALPASKAMAWANAVRQAAAQRNRHRRFPPSRVLAPTQQPQIRNYFCGPATVSEMLAPDWRHAAAARRRQGTAHQRIGHGLVKFPRLSGAESFERQSEIPRLCLRRAAVGPDGDANQDFRARSRFTIVSWDSVTGRLRTLGRSGTAPGGKPWPSPWHAPAVSGHFAAWHCR